MVLRSHSQPWTVDALPHAFSGEELIAVKERRVSSVDSLPHAFAGERPSFGRYISHEARLMSNKARSRRTGAVSNRFDEALSVANRLSLELYPETEPVVSM